MADESRVGIVYRTSSPQHVVADLRVAAFGVDNAGDLAHVIIRVARADPASIELFFHPCDPSPVVPLRALPLSLLVAMLAHKGVLLYGVGRAYVRSVRKVRARRARERV